LDAYTYFHLPIVAGIIVCAVADELMLVHHAADAGFAAIHKPGREGDPSHHLLSDAAG
jgi:hypothetical protein